ncbi:Prephenate dehydratase-domain-containing protein [Flammula alnicola]|nr:Prephenate dehydratase-domain-containing protein [Flammula alnicola]
MSHEKLKVAILGPLGTYTHEAAFNAFGSGVVYDEQNSIADVFNSLSPDVPLGVIPQENSIFGNVVETYDLLRATNSTFVRGEIILKVEHCLLVRRGVKLHQIQKIMSHEQALGQCRDFIAEKLPAAYSVKTKSTAAAAQALLDGPPDSAAICSSICATLFEGLEILFTGIQNERSNFTRFYTIAYSQQTDLPPVPGNTCQMNALFRVSPPSTPSPDISYDIVTCLKSLDLSVARIDRRPSADGIPFRSVYFIEVHGFATGEKSVGTIESWTAEVEKAASRVRCVGGTISVIGIW